MHNVSEHILDVYPHYRRCIPMTLVEGFRKGMREICEHHVVPVRSAYVELG